MEKNCKNCINCEIYNNENIIWCKRYDCNTKEVAKELKNPSCWEDEKIKDNRRFNICYNCKNFWWAFPLRPQIFNGCSKGIEIPKENKSKTCILFKSIDKKKIP